MVKTRNTPVATIYIRLQRDMDELLTTIGRHWRFNFAPEDNLEDPLWDTHRRDLVEILLTWVFYAHRTTKDSKTSAPRDVFRRSFMYNALKAQKIEQFHRFDLDVDAKREILGFTDEEMEPIKEIYEKKMAMLDLMMIEHQYGFRRSHLSREGDEYTQDELDFIKEVDEKQRLQDEETRAEREAKKKSEAED